jgi:hypothetical protein
MDHRRRRQYVQEALRPTTPTPTRRALAGVWVAAAVGFALLLALAARARGPLDDPDPARQRPGILDFGALPTPSPQLTTGVPAPGRQAVLFFQRPDGLERLCEALRTEPLGEGVDVVIVASADDARCSVVPVVADPAGAHARRFGLNTPRDGGPPVGYAVVDSGGRLRYRTLDPHVADSLDEVATMVDATR